MRKLKISSFLCFGIVLVVLVVTTLVDKITGVAGTAELIYGSVPFALLWALLALLSTAYILRRQLWKMPATMLLHASFLVILCGAATTWLFGEQGTMQVFKDAPANEFLLKDGHISRMPFRLTLSEFEIAYYEGTQSPQDYVSHVIINDGGTETAGTVSMNNILSYRHYRFYQAGYDPSMMMTRFNVSHDPYGIAITYTGYILLLISMIVFFVQPNSQFRKLLRSKVAILLLLFLIPSLGKAAGHTEPKIAPTDVAEEFSNLHILHNGRICPVQTFAHDFTLKLYGKQEYRGRSAEEVLAGWIFFPDTWKPEPMIKLKGSEVKQILGTDSRYVALTDFADSQGNYLLADALSNIALGNDVAGKSAILATNEKVSIINSLFTGASLKIFPIKDSKGNVEWYSSVDKLPDNLDIKRWTFIRKSLDLIAEKITTRQYTEAKMLIRKIHDYQQKECGEVLPSQTMFNLEKTYNDIASSKIWAMACVTIELIMFFYFVWTTASQRRPSRAIVRSLNIGLIVVLIHLTACITMRGLISHHLPLSNGFETMQALAWICFALTLIIQIKTLPLGGVGEESLPFGYLVGGLSLMVAMMSESNPAITNLMPVLHSPLLSLHVMVIMIAYALLAFMALNGISAYIFSRQKSDMSNETQRLARTSLIMLYPAVFLLTTGIFIGAVWANVSWGRYWGWDSKEVWALITMMIYALPFHRESIAWFRKPMHLHLYFIIAFLSVLMTYFGVNYFLTGLHSYA